MKRKRSSNKQSSSTPPQEDFESKRQCLPVADLTDPHFNPLAPPIDGPEYLRLVRFQSRFEPDYVSVSTTSATITSNNGVSRDWRHKFIKTRSEDLLGCPEEYKPFQDWMECFVQEFTRIKQSVWMLKKEFTTNGDDGVRIRIPESDKEWQKLLFPFEKKEIAVKNDEQPIVKNPDEIDLDINEMDTNVDRDTDKQDPPSPSPSPKPTSTLKQTSPTSKRTMQILLRLTHPQIMSLISRYVSWISLPTSVTTASAIPIATKYRFLQHPWIYYLLLCLPDPPSLLMADEISVLRDLVRNLKALRFRFWKNGVEPEDPKVVLVNMIVVLVGRIWGQRDLMDNPRERESVER